MITRAENHTPGPWHVNAIDSKAGRIVGDETSKGWDKLQINNANATIATVYRSKDARLIAAAPDLLAALRLIMSAVDNGVIEHFPAAIGIQAGAAIARAEGREV